MPYIPPSSYQSRCRFLLQSVCIESGEPVDGLDFGTRRVMDAFEFLHYEYPFGIFLFFFFVLFIQYCIILYILFDDGS